MEGSGRIRATGLGINLAFSFYPGTPSVGGGISTGVIGSTAYVNFSTGSSNGAFQMRVAQAGGA